MNVAMLTIADLPSEASEAKKFVCELRYIDTVLTQWLEDTDLGRPPKGYALDAEKYTHPTAARCLPAAIVYFYNGQEWEEHPAGTQNREGRSV